MTRLTKSAFTEELGCSEATLRRVIAALHLTHRPLDDAGATTILICRELQLLGILPSRAVEIVANLRDEVRYLAVSPTNRVWLVQTDEHLFAPISSRHLCGLLANFPIATVIDLHELYMRAAERLAVVKAEIEAAKEAA